MTEQELAYAIAKGIGETGVEGAYGSVSCSTAGDYPSMGISQWEGLEGRGDYLLSWLDEGSRFMGRRYSDLAEAGELDRLSEVLASEQGKIAQQQILAEDCRSIYLPALLSIQEMNAPSCIIYAGIWCPTSHLVVSRFLIRRAGRGHDINNLEVVRDLFQKEYYIAAAVGDEYEEGYRNRANRTYEYVAEIMGVSNRDEGL